MKRRDNLIDNSNPAQRDAAESPDLDRQGASEDPPPADVPTGLACDDILAEYQRCAMPSDDVLRGLSNQGVDLGALVRRWQRRPLLTPRLARVQPLAGGHFEFDDDVESDSVGALIFIVLDERGGIIDLCAWSPPRPPALWLGRGAMLGAESVFAPRMTEGLVVHEDIIDWLRHVCHGVVILDPARAAPLLRRAQPLQATCIEHGRFLRRLLTPPPPSILVDEGEVP